MTTWPTGFSDLTTFAGTTTLLADNGVANGYVTGTEIAAYLASLTQTLTNKTLTSPTLTTPALGVATATSINKVALTAPATGSTLTIADGKTLTASNTLTLAGTDASTLNIGGGGTLGTAAFVNTGTSGALATLANAANTWSSTQTMTAATALTLGAAAGNTGKMTLLGTTSGTVSLTVAAAAGTWSMTLPTSAGTSGYVLQTDGTGVTSWVAQSGGGGTPGGSSGNVQYNNAGAFGGATGFGLASGALETLIASTAVAATVPLTVINTNASPTGNLMDANRNSGTKRNSMTLSPFGVITLGEGSTGSGDGRIDLIGSGGAFNSVRIVANDGVTGYGQFINASGGGVSWTSATATAAIDTRINRALAKVLSIEGASSTGGTYRTIATSPAQITADQNNYAPGGTSLFQRWNSDASRNVTGLSLSQVDGQVHVITNVGSSNIVLVHQSASSTAANRFLNSSGADITLSANQAADLVYDGTQSRWLVFKKN